MRIVVLLLLLACVGSAAAQPRFSVKQLPTNAMPLKAQATRLKAYWSTGGQVNITADRFVVSDGTNSIVLSNVNVTPNAATAGPAANGRDQASAFGSEVWIYGHVIYNGTTIAGLWSLSATAPTLPSGYTYAGVATVAKHISGGTVRDYYQIASIFKYGSGFHSILSGGTATSFTAVSASGFIPPDSRIGLFHCAWLNTSSTGVTFEMSGDGTQSTSEVVNTTVGAYQYFYFESPVNSSRQIYYRVGVSTGSNAYLYVAGFVWN